MKAFAYVNATSEKDAVAALKFDGIALPLAGGQDLLARMKDYIDTPERVVNVKNALDRTAAPTSGGGWRIGASMKIVDLLEHADIGKMYPAIIAAATDIGTPQIRHQGTVGGNLNQRPRCWYFRNEEFVCYKKGGSRCFAVNGENQYHAIFGNDGPSHIVHPSSLAVPFVAYGATFRVIGPKGEREVAAAEFFTMPTLQNVLKENVLDDDELLMGLDGYKSAVVFVSNEVGLGLVPETPLGRSFRDAQGRLTMRIAECADRVILMAAGLPLTMKDRPPRT